MRSAKASVQKLGDNYYRVQVEAGRDPVTGKRVRISKRVRGSRKEAERVKVKELAKIGETEQARQSMTLDDFYATLYLPDAKARLRKTTIEGYESHYHTYIEKSIGRTHLQEITPLIINMWLNTIDGQARKFEAFKLLRQVLNKAVKWDLIEYNPCNRIDAPKKERYKPQVLTVEETVTYINYFRNHCLEAAVLILIGAGLRRSELCALNWSDITLDGAITIDNAVTVVHGKANEDTTKTEFSKRVVHLPPTIAKRLNEIREDYSVPICHEDNGERMNPDRITRVYNQHIKQLPADIKRVSLKNLRHTSLSLSIESGVDLFAVSRRAGHSNVGITAAYYLRPHESVDINAADSLDQFLANSGA